MNKAAEIALGVTLGAGIGFGLLAAAGVAADGVFGEKTKAGDVQDKIDTYKQDLADYEVYNGTLVRYGEACLAVLDNYTIDGPLANVPQDIVVTDLLANPGQPCGDNATEVRIAAQDVINVKSTLSKLQAYDINSDYRKVESINNNNKNDDEFTLWLYAGAVGALIGGILGVFVGIENARISAESKKR